MLLFVGDAGFNKSRGLCEIRLLATLQQTLHRGVDMRSIGHDVGQVRAGYVSARRSRLAFPQCLIVGVEKVTETRIEHGVSGQAGLQQEGFPEPARMCEVPFGRRNIVHGLRAHILTGQGCGERRGARPECMKALQK